MSCVTAAENCTVGFESPLVFTPFTNDLRRNFPRSSTPVSSAHLKPSWVDMKNSTIGILPRYSPVAGKRDAQNHGFTVSTQLASIL